MIADATGAGDEAMNEALIETLYVLKSDPSVVVRLYKELYWAAYFAVVRVGTGPSPNTAAYLSYDTVDGIRELPLFTRGDFVLEGLSEGAVAVRMDGPDLWVWLVDLIETQKCEVGIDPGQGHGIRLNKEMVLGMIAMYGSSAAEDHG